MEIAACEECGGIFERLRKDSRCCSPLCHIISRRKRPEIRADNRARSRAWHADPKNKEKRRLKRKPAPARFAPCKECGEVFQVKTKALFCKHSCQARHYRRTNPELFRAMHLRNKATANAISLRNYRRTKAKTPWKILLEAARFRARRKNISFTVDDAWCEARWTGRCELTDLEFVLDSPRRIAMSPSLDQINPSGGYTTENARFVLWAINTAKGTDSDETLYKIAEALISKVSRKD